MEVRIDDLAFGGEGVGRVDGKVCFVRRALPGERVLVRSARTRARYDRMELLEVLEASPHRRAPLCPHTSVCGGCSLQELAYGEQLAAKAQQVRELLARVGGIEIPEPHPPIASPRLTRYRNKMEFTFAPRAWDPAGPPGTPSPGPALGLHVPGRFDAVFDLEECVLASAAAVAACHATRDFARETNLVAYLSRPDTGLLRHLVIREGTNTGEVLVALVVRSPLPESRPLAERLEAQVPGLVGFVEIVNDRRATIARGDRETVHWGRGHIVERLGGLEFQVQAQSFFQTNTPGAEALVGILDRLLVRSDRGRLLDLYCGAGTLGLVLSSRFAEVIGVEQVEGAVEDAGENARRNGIANARFLRAEVEAWLESDEARSLLPCTVVVDPPRAGLHPRALAALCRFRPSWLAYVSCNPSTLARDAAGLVAAGFRAEEMQVLDLFPHTAHVETVVLFTADRSSDGGQISAR